MTRLTLVAARARNGVIGRDGGLPWRIPADLAHFKATTMGAPIVMGRRTWESIGRPLPGRRNVVVSRNPELAVDGAEVVASLDAALAVCGDVPEVFVIGGAELYAAALPVADRLVLTEVDADVDGDTYFPPLDAREWQATSTEAGEPGNGGADALPYRFVTYERRGAG